MTIGIGNITQHTYSSPSTSRTFSHEVFDGDNRLLLVFTSNRAGSVAAVTYGGEPLTFLTNDNNSIQAYESCWYMESPPVGDGSIVITLQTGADAHGHVAVSLSGAVTIKNPNTNNGISSSIGVSVTTESGDSWVFGAACSQGADTQPFNPSGDMLEKWDDKTGVSTLSDVGFTGGYVVAPTTQTYEWKTTASASDDYAVVAGEIIAAPSAPPAAAALPTLQMNKFPSPL